MDGPENRSDRLAQLAEMIAELAAALAEPDPPPAAEAVVLLDVEEAARLLGISRAKLYDGPVKRGKLLAVLIDSRRLVPRSALDAYVTALIERAS
ncbi:MAG TPA: helix-turn-helix domain-containing protein [Jatrophihabitantaceae bacterium]|nr:helix-turn-helix domain-containing protein [Jatrophihabitantaceae bacterium]